MIIKIYNLYMITNNDVKNIIKFIKNKDNNEIQKYINNSFKIKNEKVRESINKLKFSTNPIKKIDKIRSIYLKESNNYNYNLNESVIPYEPDRIQKEYPGYEYLQKYYDFNERNLMKGGFFAALNDAANDDGNSEENDTQQIQPPNPPPPQMYPQQSYTQQMYPQQSPPNYQSSYQRYSYQRPIQNQTQQQFAQRPVMTQQSVTAPALLPMTQQPVMGQRQVMTQQPIAAPGPIIQTVPPHSHPKVPVEEHTHLPAEKDDEENKENQDNEKVTVKVENKKNEEIEESDSENNDFAKDFNKLTHKISYNSELPYNKIGLDKPLQDRYMDLEKHISNRADEIQRITDENLSNPYQINIMEEIKFKLINEMRNQISSKIDKYIAQNLVNQMPVQNTLPQPSVYQNTVPPFFSPNIILP